MQEGLHQVHHHQHSDRGSDEDEESEEKLKEDKNKEGLTMGILSDFRAFLTVWSKKTLASWE
jgi:hypothetical protein